MLGKIERITLSGLAGSGKSAVGKILAKKLRFEFISIGEFTRKFAMEKYGLGIDAFQALCEKDKSIDMQIDKDFQKECNSKEKIVADCRLGFHFFKENAFHILLKVSDAVAIQRIQNADRKEEEATAENIGVRNERMIKRAVEIYGIDFTEDNNYNFVIDTDPHTPEEISRKIISCLEEQKFDLNNEQKV